MSLDKTFIQQNQSPIQKKTNSTAISKQDFSSVYQGLYKTLQTNSKKFIPLVDVTKHKKNVQRRNKIIAKYFDSQPQNQIINLPFIMSPARQLAKQLNQNEKQSRLQIQKFSVNNQTVLLKQKLRKQVFVTKEQQKTYQRKVQPAKIYHSILSQKNKRLTNLSKRSVADKIQNMQIQRIKHSQSALNKKIVSLNPESTSIEFRKNKLIQAIKQVQQNQFQTKKQLSKIQYSQKSILNFPFMDQQMIGSTKLLQIQPSPVADKKHKKKSLQKIYALKEQIKANNPNGIKKINWKSTPFPLIKIQKTCFNKILLRYLGLQNIMAPQTGYYKFYLGDGNNAQVIRQALKNRGYWMQVESLNQRPNFIWGQFRFQQYVKYESKKLQKLTIDKSTPQCSKLKQLQVSNFIKYHHTDYVKGCKKILTQNTFNLYMSEIIQKFKRGDKIQYYEQLDKYVKNYINEVKTTKFNNVGIIRGMVQTNRVQNYKLESNYKSENKFQSNRMQSYKSQTLKQNKQFYKSNDFRLQNHVKNSHLIGNKKSLFNMFLQYCQQNNMSTNQYIPPTIHVKLGNQLDQDSILFLIQDQIPQGPWLVKPGQDTNRGHGIKIIQSIQELMRQIKRRNQQFIQKTNQNNQNNNQMTNSNVQFNNFNPQQTQKQLSVIIQKYIEPYLYEGRKFDIRQWVLWSNNKLWWYKQGYIRTSSKQFNIKSTNRIVHLTNDAVQIHNQDYGKYQPANKLSFSQFQRYLSQYYLQQQNSKQQTNYKNQNKFNHIYQQMKQLTKMLFNIAKQKIYEDTLNFQLFGLDFLVDKDLKVWLIQCNTNPSLQVHCSLQSRLVPQLIQNVLNIVIDPIFPCPQKRMGRQYLNTVWNQQSFKFQLLIDGNQTQQN